MTQKEPTDKAKEFLKKIQKKNKNRERLPRGIHENFIR